MVNVILQRDIKEIDIQSIPSQRSIQFSNIHRNKLWNYKYSQVHNYCHERKPEAFDYTQVESITIVLQKLAPSIKPLLFKNKIYIECFTKYPIS